MPGEAAPEVSTDDVDVVAGHWFALTTQLTQGIVLVAEAPDFRVRMCSVPAATTIGADVEALLGATLLDFVAPELRPAARARLEQLAGGQRDLNRHVTAVQHRDGRSVCLEVDARAVRDELGTLRYVFVTARTPEADTDAVDGPAIAARAHELELALHKVLEVVVGVLGTDAEGTGLVDLSALERLSRREREIVLPLLRGRRVPSIAEELYLSQSTVRNHLSNVFRKVGVDNQAQLLDRLIRRSGP